MEYQCEVQINIVSLGGVMTLLSIAACYPVMMYHSDYWNIPC